MEVSIKNWIVFFEDIGRRCYYESSLKPTWEKYEYGKEPWQALILFLGGYAFERQGRNPSYPHAAVDTMKEYKDDLNEKKIWKSFREKLEGDGISLNEKLCPLYPKDHKSVLARLNGRNIVTLVGEEMKNDEVEKAFDFMKSIRGIGPKIASFFLRDVKEVLDITPKDKRWLLQPIDIWVLRTVNRLSNKLLDVNRDTDREEAAKFIVDNSNNPELVNMGMWVFGARVCDSEYRHIKYLRDFEMAKMELRNYLKEQNIKN